MSYFNIPRPEWLRKRLSFLIVIIGICFVVLAARLFYLQGIKGSEYARLAENNCIRLDPINAPRGFIYDRDGVLLVDNLPAFDLCIVLEDAKPFSKVIAKLSKYTGIPIKEIEAKLDAQKDTPPYRTLVIKSNINWDMLTAVETHRYALPGISIRVHPIRKYVYPRSTSHLIGYLGEINAEELKAADTSDYRPGSYIGKFGIEREYEKYLRGFAGGRQIEVNAKGKVVRIRKTVNAYQGDTVYLAIDDRVQKRAELLLEGKAGAAVAIDPQTGEILAMVSAPTFDANQFVKGLSREQWREISANPAMPMENKAVRGLYPPASTFKIVTAIAALEEGVVDEKTTVTCTGAYKFGGRDFRCWKRGGHGTMNVIQALAQSCDVYFYQAGVKLGVDRIAKYSKMLGLGEPTGVGMDNEKSGLVPSSKWKEERFKKPWYPGETLSIAIGQGYNLVTPIQMASLVAAVGNRGILYKPLLLHKIVPANGDSEIVTKPVERRKLKISQKTMDLVHQGLWVVVEGGGTGGRARVRGVSVSGKTGTAQVVSRRLDDIGGHKIPRPHSWFVGYAPSENPQIAVAVIIEHGGDGSAVAAPVAQQMMEVYFTPKIKPTKKTNTSAKEQNTNGTGIGEALPEATSSLISEAVIVSPKPERE